MEAGLLMRGYGQLPSTSGLKLRVTPGPPDHRWGDCAFPRWIDSPWVMRAFRRSAGTRLKACGELARSRIEKTQRRWIAEWLPTEESATARIGRCL